ncbi:MAG: Maf family protein [Vulcanococcus sp. Clear-D1]|nr:Maf family protein [Vulcanococcus sp. Clear-D1]
MAFIADSSERGRVGVVARIEGCFSNVIGLSLPLLRRRLAEA